MAKLYPLIYGMICAYLGFLYIIKSCFSLKYLQIWRAKTKKHQIWLLPEIFFQGMISLERIISFTILPNKNKVYRLPRGFALNFNHRASGRCARRRCEIWCGAEVKSGKLKELGWHEKWGRNFLGQNSQSCKIYLFGLVWNDDRDRRTCSIQITDFKGWRVKHNLDDW